MSSTGLTQIKGIAPPGLAPGMASVIVTVGGKNSNTMLVSVKSQAK